MEGTCCVTIHDVIFDECVLIYYTRRGIDAWVRNKSILVDMTGAVATAFTPE